MISIPSLFVCGLLLAQVPAQTPEAPTTAGPRVSAPTPSWGPRARQVAFHGTILDAAGKPLANATIAPYWFTPSKSGRGRGRASSAPIGPLGLASANVPLITDASGSFSGTFVVTSDTTISLTAFDASGKLGGSTVVSLKKTMEPVVLRLKPLVMVQSRFRMKDAGQKTPPVSLMFSQYANFQNLEASAQVPVVPGKYTVGIVGADIISQDRQIIIPEGKDTFDLGEIPLTLAPSLVSGKTTIAFDSRTMNGQKITFPKSYPKKLVMIDFWATWCMPCMAEVPNLVKTYEALHDRGFEILGVTLDLENSGQKVRSVAKAKGMTWPQIYDGKGWKAAIAQSYGVTGIPAAFLVDGDTGEIVAAGNDLRGERLAPTIEAALSRKFGKK
ncbi:MAG: TlpA family protein disulfide reductase [Cytophagales bacterium]|nr:TlpA family protein disulfide reductase [Armatimonadota bacterium]